MGRARKSAQPSAPQLAPLSEPRPTSPVGSWIAGGALSVAVLALTLVDSSWLDRLTGDAPPPAEPVVATGESIDTDPSAPELSVTAAPAADEANTAPPPAVPPAALPQSEATPYVPPPYAKSPPRVIAISAEGRGRTAVEAEPEAAAPEARHTPAAQPAPAPARPAAQDFRVLPIMVERPQPGYASELRLTGGGEAAAAAEADDFVRQPASSTGRIKVFIHYAAGRAEDSSTAARLADYLRARDFEVAEVRPVEMPIGSPGVRYFFERDQAESRRLLDDLGRFFRTMPDHAPVATSDFTDFTPKPPPGNVEVWLPATS